MDLAIKSVVVLLIASISVLALHRRSAAVRHLVWTAAFGALLVLPLFSVILPALRVPVPAAMQTAGARFESGTATAARTPAGAIVRPLPAKLTPPVQRIPWSEALLLLWALGALASLAKMSAAWLAVNRIRKQAKPLELPETAALAGPLGIDRPVPVLETASGSMPMACGFVRPVVLLPADAALWTEHRRRAVLLHELAHVRRGDTVSHAVARFTLGLYWWNPIAWFAWREFLRERERAADDVVLSTGEQPSAYGTHLLEIARGLRLVPSLRGAAVAMAGHSELEGRLRAVLDPARRRSAPGRASIAATAVIAICFAAFLAPLRAQQAAEKVPSESYSAARRLLETEAANLGVQDQRYGLLMLKLAGLERTRPKLGDAVEFYNKALLAFGDRPDSALAITGLGLAAFVQEDLEKAAELFERAQLIDPSKGAEAAMWLAVVRERQNRLADAESAYAAALSAYNPDSPGRLTTMELYANFLRRQNRANEASSITEQAVPLRNGLYPRPGPVATAGVYRIGGGVTPPKLTSKVEPEYTEEAKLAKYQGTTVLYAEIGVDGQPRNVQVTRGLGLGLNQKAVEAVMQWRFSPGLKDGQPVVVAATIEVNWRLL